MRGGELAITETGVAAALVGELLAIIALVGELKQPFDALGEGE